MAKNLIEGVETLTLVKALFDEFATESGADTDQLLHVKVAHFYAWCHQRMRGDTPATATGCTRCVEKLFKNKEQLHETYEFQVGTYIHTVQMLFDPFMLMAVMRKWWPLLVIRRPPQRHQVEMVTVTVSLKYVEMEKTVNVPVQMTPPDGQIFNDAKLLVAARSAVDSFEGLLAIKSSDCMFETIRDGKETALVDVAEIAEHGLGL